MTPHHRSLLRFATWFYAGLAVTGVAWVVIRDGLPALIPDAGTAAFGAGCGLASGLAVVGIWRGLVYGFGAFERFERELVDWFEGMSLAGVGWLALLSSVGEELLYRGGMQGSFGLAVTSVIFGATHVPLKRSMALWPVFALLVGWLLGWLYQITGTLAAPVMGHFTINFLNLWRLSRAPREEYDDADSHAGATGANL